MNKPEGYADDTGIAATAVQAFGDAIQRGALDQTPFFEQGAWRFAQVGKKSFFNTAHGIPAHITEHLRSSEALKAANKMPANQWVSVLRNALAHGGVAYLDEDGNSSHGQPVKMYAFVSGKYGRRTCAFAEEECPSGLGELERLNILRISEDHYRNFLRKWVQWLASSQIDKVAAT